MKLDHNETTILTQDKGEVTCRTMSCQDPERHLISQKSQPCSSFSSDDLDGPDGGFWAWIVVLGSFLANGLIFGVINCFGVLFEAVQHKFLLDSQDAAFLTSCVGSTTVGITFFFSFIASMLTDRYGVRPVAVFGGCLATVGMFLASFATSIYHLIITYGFICGVGFSLAYTPSLTILGHYFTKRLGIVNGVVTAGSSFFTMVLSIGLKAIVSVHGLTVTLRILTGLMVLLIFAGMTFIEKRPLKRACLPKEPLFNKDIWRQKLYILWVVAVPIALFGYFVPYVHLDNHVKNIFPDLSKADLRYKGSLLVTTLGASSGLGRIIFGPLSDSPRVNRIVLQQLAFVTIGTLTLLLIFTHNFSCIVAICVGLGLSDGCFISQLGPLAFDLVGSSGASQAIGFLLAFCSVPLTIGPPFAGYLYDLYGSYKLAFLCAGIPPFLGCLLMMPMHRNRRHNSASLAQSTCTERSSDGLPPRNSYSQLPSSSPTCPKLDIVREGDHLLDKSISGPSTLDVCLGISTIVPSNNNANR